MCYSSNPLIQIRIAWLWESLSGSVKQATQTDKITMPSPPLPVSMSFRNAFVSNF